MACQIFETSAKEADCIPTPQKSWSVPHYLVEI